MRGGVLESGPEGLISVELGWYAWGYRSHYLSNNTVGIDLASNWNVHLSTAVNERLDHRALVEDSEAPQTQTAGLNPICA